MQITYHLDGKMLLSIIQEIKKRLLMDMKQLQILLISLDILFDETIEEEELQNQMLAVASINQSRSQSYAAASRREELATPRDD